VGDKILLEIQTDVSGMIQITEGIQEDEFANFDNYYSVKEFDGYGGVYWSFGLFSRLDECLNSIEHSPDHHAINARSYVSWWLNFKPYYIDEELKPKLRKKIELYYKTGEIVKALKNSIEGYPEAIFEWHEKLEFPLGQNDFILNQKDEFNTNLKLRTINIYFDSFPLLLYTNIELRIDSFDNFQKLLDYIYKIIEREVPPHSYDKKWILYNSTRGEILRKNSSIDNRSLHDAGINSKEIIICYRK